VRQKLNMIVLGVRDVLSSVAFYEALGWKRSTAGHDEFALFDLGGVALALLPRQAVADDARLTDHGTGGFAGFALGYIARSADDVYRIIAKAGELGAVVTQPAKASPRGHNGYFTDPDGHLIEVLYEDAWKFDDRDNLIL
jgi:predicted lactoylglutathione lyase